MWNDVKEAARWAAPSQCARTRAGLAIAAGSTRSAGATRRSTSGAAALGATALRATALRPALGAALRAALRSTAL